MKRSFTIFALSILLYLVPGWNVTFAQYVPEPVDLTASMYNPVLVHGAPGSYDGDLVVAPHCLWDNGTFYLFYTGNAGTCFATSADGFSYTKFEGNPVFTASGIGFDSLGAGGAPILIKIGTEWVMYYNARQYPGWGPGESVGRATADSLTGAWERYPEPMLTLGGPGEWDRTLICATSILAMDTGGFIMFYFGSEDFNGIWLMGMATSPDGISWTKYNDPSTTDPPYAESDPILPAGGSGEFDEWGVLGAGVFKKGGYYHMYYSGMGPGPAGYRADIGFAYSTDGIAWEKWMENPVYVQEDDPHFDPGTMIFEQPSVYLFDSTLFLFYDYGVIENSLGVAMGISPFIVGIQNGTRTRDEVQITNSPNPVSGSTVFCYLMKEPGNAVIRVYDNFGRLVAEPVNAWQSKGEQRVSFNVGALPDGIYFYRLIAGYEKGNGKMIIKK